MDVATRAALLALTHRLDEHFAYEERDDTLMLERVETELHRLVGTP